MEANELRIGNKLIRPNGNIATVTWGVILDVDYGDNTYQPIPLTEEILLKCGFKPDVAGIFHSKIHIYYNHHWFLFGQYAGEKVKFQYLHQLQNLYFALTGEELKIDL